MTVKWANKEQFFKRLSSTVPKMQAELTKANEKSADIMVESAVRLVAVDQGDLRTSIRMRKGGGPTAFIVEAGGPLTTKAVRSGVDAEYDYALGIEFGTQKMRAQPFFWPAYRLNRKPMKARAGAAIRKAIKAAGF